MGVSVNVVSFDIPTLFCSIQELAESPENTSGRTADEFIVKVLPHFGETLGSEFVVLHDEYHEAYDSLFELFHALEMFFGMEDVYFHEYRRLGKHANAEELLYELGIEPIVVESE